MRLCNLKGLCCKLLVSQYFPHLICNLQPKITNEMFAGDKSHYFYSAGQKCCSPALLLVRKVKIHKAEMDLFSTWGYKSPQK